MNKPPTMLIINRNKPAAPNTMKIKWIDLFESVSIYFILIYILFFKEKKEKKRKNKYKYKTNKNIYFTYPLCYYPLLY